MKKAGIVLAAVILFSASAGAGEAYGGVFKNLKEGLYLMLDACGVLPEEFIKSRAEKDKDAALAYLNDRYAKYGDVFTPVSHIPGGWAYDFDEVVFKSQKYGENFVVHLHEDTHEPYSDGYAGVRMREPSTEYFTGMLSGYEAYAAKVNIKGGLKSSYELFSECIDSGNCKVDVFFFFKEKFDDAICRAILEKIAKKKIRGYFQFIAIKEGLYSTKLTLNEVSRHAQKYIANEMHYNIDGANVIIRAK